MEPKEDVVYRKGMTEIERAKAAQETIQEHRRSHAAEGAFAGFMLFTILGRYFLGPGSWLAASVLGGAGAAFGALVGFWEARSG